MIESKNPVCLNCGGTTNLTPEEIIIPNYDEYQTVKAEVVFFCQKCIEKADDALAAFDPTPY